MKKRRRRKFPLSGKKRIDCVFRKVIRVIEKWKAIYKKDGFITDPRDETWLLHGYMPDGHKEVYITHHPPDTPASKVLLHEALHKLSSVHVDCTKNDRILRREEYYWKRFTREQKIFLRNYIPKHTVKKEPQA